MADEMTPEQEHPEHDNEQPESGGGQVTRRQFLVGAGVGAVVGAAGVAGVLSFVKPTPETKPAVAQPSAPSTASPVTQIASNVPPTMRQVTLNIDGKSYDLTVDVRMSLWEVMVYQLGLSSSNLGCDRAQCGACAVVVDGRAVNGCTLLAARLGRGQKIITVDGLNKGTRLEELHPIARAFHQQGGYQCGLCTRGLIMSTYALLQKNPSPNEAEVQDALAGNICRCGEYAKVYDSVFRAAEDMRKKA
ncbi:MAG: (2Fe-2S)-binding protein [Chloroflexi bacterium]|nr:(2Fe-2S)-binding protein [Chloroflexota bacterium]